MAIEVAQSTRPDYQPPDAGGVAVGLTATFAPIVLRRRVPLAALLATALGFVVARVVFDSIEASVSFLALCLALYSAGVHGRPRRRSVACGAAVALLIAELWREVVDGAPPIKNVLVVQAFVLVLNLALVLGAWALGAAVRRGRHQAGDLAERTRQLELEREETPGR